MENQSEKHAESVSELWRANQNLSAHHPDIVEAAKSALPKMGGTGERLARELGNADESRKNTEEGHCLSGVGEMFGNCGSVGKKANRCLPASWGKGVRRLSESVALNRQPSAIKRSFTPAAGHL